MLGYCWLFALFLFGLGWCFTHGQGEVDLAPRYLAAIFPQSSSYFLVQIWEQVSNQSCHNNLTPIASKAWDSPVQEFQNLWFLILVSH